jgi:hypothetical protein
MEEAGGTVGGLGGGAAGTGACVAIGVATEGIGLVVCGLVGAVIGSGIGHRVGSYVGDWWNQFVEDKAWEAYKNYYKSLGVDLDDPDTVFIPQQPGDAMSEILGDPIPLFQ